MQYFSLRNRNRILVDVQQSDSLGSLQVECFVSRHMKEATNRTSININFMVKLCTNCCLRNTNMYVYATLGVRERGQNLWLQNDFSLENILLRSCHMFFWRVLYIALIIISMLINFITLHVH